MVHKLAVGDAYDDERFQMGLIGVGSFAVLVAVWFLAPASVRDVVLWGTAAAIALLLIVLAPRRRPKDQDRPLRWSLLGAPALWALLIWWLAPTDWQGPLFIGVIALTLPLTYLMLLSSPPPVPAAPSDQPTELPASDDAGVRPTVVLAVGGSVVGLAYAASKEPYPGDAFAVAVAVVAAPVTFGLWLLLFVAIDLALRRVHRADPRPEVAWALLEALWWLSPLDVGARRGTPTPDRRRTAAEALDRAANRVATDWPTVARGLSGEIKQRLAERGQRVSAWLITRAEELLIMSPESVPKISENLAKGLTGVCQCDWAAVEEESHDVSSQSWLQRALPRIGTAAGLAAAAVLLPIALGGVLTDSQADGLRALLLLGALGGLVSPPESAVNDAVKDVKSSVVKRLLL
jgi:hypothetical protein